MIFVSSKEAQAHAISY